MHDGWIWIEALWNASGMSRLLDRHGEELLATALVVLVALSLYRFVLQRARQHVDRNRGRALALRWRNALVAGVLMVLLLAWGSDLKSMAVSVAALGAALILALREADIVVDVGQRQRRRIGVPPACLMVAAAVDEEVEMELAHGARLAWVRRR